MITKKIVTIGDRTYQFSKSDSYMIRKKGTEEVYAEAYDLAGSTFDYEETDEPLIQDIDNQLITNTNENNL